MVHGFDGSTLHAASISIFLNFLSPLLQVELAQEQQKKLFKFSKGAKEFFVQVGAAVIRSWCGGSRQMRGGTYHCTFHPASSPVLPESLFKPVHPHPLCVLPQYRKPMLQSAFDLQSRLTNQVFGEVPGPQPCNGSWAGFILPALQASPLLSSNCFTSLLYPLNFDACVGQKQFSLLIPPRAGWGAGQELRRYGRGAGLFLLCLFLFLETVNMLRMKAG